MQRPDTMQSYLQDLKVAERLAPASSRLSRLARALVPRALRPGLKIALTWSIMPLSLGDARRVASRGEELRLHLGCGTTYLEGWVNVDMVGSRANFFWDLRYRLPFPSSSVAAIFHEHLLEHLPLAGAFSFTQACWQLLRPGGILRIGVPDFGRYVESYADSGQFIDTLRPGRPTWLLALAEVIYHYGHQSVWDASTLLLMLHELGFREVGVRQFGDSALQPPPDSVHRQAETLYVEAVK